MTALDYLERCVVGANGTRRSVRRRLSRVSLLSFFMLPNSEMMVEKQVPVTHHHMHLVVALTKAADPRGTITPKGKAAMPLATQPRAHKVTRVTSPLPEAIIE